MSIKNDIKIYFKTYKIDIFYIFIYNNQIDKKVHLSYSNSNLNPLQWYIIKYILDNISKNKEVFQKDIEKEFDISKSHASEILKNFERDGLIIRNASNKDSRMKNILATQKAVEISNEIETNISIMEDNLTQNITDDELNDLFKLLNKLIENIN